MMWNVYTVVVSLLCLMQLLSCSTTMIEASETDVAKAGGSGKKREAYEFLDDNSSDLLKDLSRRRAQKKKVAFSNDYISHRTALPVEESPDQPMRINILVPSYAPPFDSDLMALIHFSIRMSDHRKNGGKMKVRWLQFQAGAMDAKAWNEKLNERRPSLSNEWKEFADRVEFLNTTNSNAAIPCSKTDLFMATVHYSAPMAWETTKKLGYRKSILYFIQDYEPGFFPHNSQKMEAEESYSVPHYPIFSTPALMNYFKVKRKGLYSRCTPRMPGKGGGIGGGMMGKSPSSSSAAIERDSDEKEDKNVGAISSEAIAECEDWGFAFEPVVKKYGAFSMERFREASSPPRIKRLVAEVKPHLPRYVYDLVVSSVGAAIRDGVFGEHPETEWKFLGVGALRPERQCGLGGPDCSICMDIYNFGMTKKMAARSDIALSLILTPTSLPAIEYAGAGLITVVNTGYPGAKTVDLYRNVSKNFVPVPLHLDDIVEGLRAAVKLVDDGEARKKNSDIRWAKEWSDERCFGKPLFEKIARWGRDPIGPAKYETVDHPSVLSEEDLLSLGGVDPLLLNM